MNPANRKLLISYNCWKPHYKKVTYFIKQYTYPLKSTEFKIKFIIRIKGKLVTYNPDFYCVKTKSFLEVVTSKPNISEQSPKWRTVIRGEWPLKIFWWEGQNITKFFKKYNDPSKIIP